MKIIFYFVWLSVLAIGAVCYSLVPEAWQYLEAFATGGVSVVLLSIAKELD